jgi:uncharacterized protein
MRKKKIFVDTGYWVAVSNPQDALHEQAMVWSQRIVSQNLITSEMVLNEFLDGCSRQGYPLRQIGVDLIIDILNNPILEIVPQTSELFLSAFQLYRNRLDKRWSHTDCSSFYIMRKLGIREALAHDKHFEQAGFVALLRG